MKIRSVRILDTIICSGSLVWLFSPALDAVKLTLPGGWLHLSFCGHGPYLFRSDDGNCSELAPGLMFDDFLPRRRIPAFLPYGIKASRVSTSDLVRAAASVRFHTISRLLLWAVLKKTLLSPLKTLLSTQKTLLSSFKKTLLSFLLSPLETLLSRRDAQKVSFPPLVCYVPPHQRMIRD